MEEIKEVLKELNSVLLVEPVKLIDGDITEFSYYSFVKEKVQLLENPLWDYAIENVSMKLYDLDIFSINIDSEDIKYKLDDFDLKSLNILAKHYLDFNLDSYSYKESDLGQFINNDCETINLETITKLISFSISSNLELLTNSIFSQLKTVQKEEWLELYEIEEEDDYYSEDILSQLECL